MTNSPNSFHDKTINATEPNSPQYNTLQTRLSLLHDSVRKWLILSRLPRINFLTSKKTHVIDGNKTKDRSGSDLSLFQISTFNEKISRSLYYHF